MPVDIPTLVSQGAKAPTYTTEGAAGADVRAHIEKPIVLDPGESALVPTGLRVAIPEGYEIQVRPRSGLAYRHKVTVLNTPGTIDSDYRGEIGIILINHSEEPFTIEPDMRIAQLVLAPVATASFIVHEDLVATHRGEGGFGHTGLKESPAKPTGSDCAASGSLVRSECEAHTWASRAEQSSQTRELEAVQDGLDRVSRGFLNS